MPNLRNENPFKEGSEFRQRIEGDLAGYGERKTGLWRRRTNKARAEALFMKHGAEDVAAVGRMRDKINRHNRRNPVSRILIRSLSSIEKERALYYYYRTKQDLQVLGGETDETWRAKAQELMPGIRWRAKRISLRSGLSSILQGFAGFLKQRQAYGQVKAIPSEPVKKEGSEKGRVELVRPAAPSSRRALAAREEGLNGGGRLEVPKFAAGPASKVAVSAIPAPVPVPSGHAPASSPELLPEITKLIEAVSAGIRADNQKKRKGETTTGKQLEACFKADSKQLQSVFKRLLVLKPRHDESWLTAQLEGIRTQVIKKLHVRYHPDRYPEELQEKAKELIVLLQEEVTQSVRKFKKGGEGDLTVIDIAQWSAEWDKNFEEVMETYRQMDVRLENLEQSHAKLRQEQVEIRQGFAEIREGFAEVREGFAEVNESCGELEQTMVRLEHKKRKKRTREEKKSSPSFTAASTKKSPSTVTSFPLKMPSFVKVPSPDPESASSAGVPQP